MVLVKMLENDIGLCILFTFNHVVILSDSQSVWTWLIDFWIKIIISII